jgi:hypothetical protein
MAATETSSFDGREIACGSEAAARSEAERQQLAEDPDEVEWIYLRNRCGVWVARRTPRHLQVTSRVKSSRKRQVLGALVDALLGFTNW